MDDITSLTLGNLTQFIQGKETKVLPEMLLVASKYTPGGNLFYTRLALQRLLWDQLRQAAGP